MMKQEESLRIIGISGSLRHGSYNSALLAAAVSLAPEGITIVPTSLAGIPLFNADVEAKGDPESVVRLKQSIASADGLLLVTPEYNYSVPGVLKNALDWLSRPARASVLRQKPIAIMGAGGRFGTVRAQMHLREVLLHSDARVLGQPQLFVSRASEKFDPEGKLVDEPTRLQLVKFLRAFESWIIHWSLSHQ